MRRDREYQFCEDLITDDAGVVDPQLSILAKVSPLLEVLRLGRSHESVEQLWAQFSLTTSCVKIEVCWSRNEILVSIRIFSVSYTYWFRKITYLFRKITYLFHIFFTDVPVSSQFCWMGYTHGSFHGFLTGWSRVASLLFSSGRVRNHPCFRSDVWQRHVPSSVSSCTKHVQWRSRSGCCYSWAASKCCLSLSVACCSGWGLTCASRHIHRVCWEWVPRESGRLPHLWLAADQKMPSEVCLNRHWELGSVFDDGVHHRQSETRWAQRLDGISTWFEMCCCIRGPLDAFSGRGRR